MDKQEKKRLVILLSLLVVAGMVALFQMWGQDGFSGGASSAEEISYNPRNFPEVIATNFGDAQVDAEQRDHRNPFTYGAPPTPTPDLTPPPTRPPTPPPPTRPPPRTRGPRKPPKPRPPVFDREFIGQFGPDRRRVAAFRMKGKDEVTLVDVAIAGQIIDKKFIVREIGLESVVIGYVGFAKSEDTRVPLAED